MSHALLLSPDDQAVSAITGVLEEMSVTCERPLDGLSAAQKINSRSFDLVLVDCENLAAAKLIFEVCQRPQSGNNPVPIAIVDGRAGLPTAFRLGAELILTKPVSKDQARSTIRAAVGRVRKELPGVEGAPVAAPASAPLLASAAAASAQTEPSVPSAPTLGAKADDSSAVATELPALKAAAAAEETLPRAGAALIAKLGSGVPAASVNAKLVRAAKFSDAAVRAELRESNVGGAIPKARPTADVPAPAVKPQVEPRATPTVATRAAELSPAQTSPTVAKNKKVPGSRSGSFLRIAALLLLMAGLGFYGAWMYAPGFRSLAQPLTQSAERVAAQSRLQEILQPHWQRAVAQVKAGIQPLLAAAGIGRPPQAVLASPSPMAPQAVAQKLSAQAKVVPVSNVAANAPTVPAAQAPQIQRIAAPSKAVQSVAAQSVVPPPLAEAKLALAAASAAALPGESGAIILSSKGAEKRLARKVAPDFPGGGHSQAAAGPIVLKELVDASGQVTAVQRVDGDATLAEAAIKAVRQWRYKPYVRDGKPLSFQTLVILDSTPPAR